MGCSASKAFVQGLIDEKQTQIDAQSEKIQELLNSVKEYANAFEVKIGANALCFVFES
jgi:hypothetical protein